jgi:hypothetical protein
MLVRLRRVPEIAVMLAVLGFLVYALALLVTACRSPVEAPLYAKAQGIDFTREITLDCDNTAVLLAATDTERKLLANRLETLAEDDPGMFILGVEYLSLRKLDAMLHTWRKRNGCSLG